MEFYTIKEIQQILKIGLNQAYDLCKRDDFPAMRLQSGWRVDKAKFEEWCEQRMNGSKSSTYPLPKDNGLATPL